MGLESLRFWYLRRVVGTALGAMGPAAGFRLARSLARGVYDLNPPGRLRAEERLKRAFGGRLSDDACGAIVRTMYEHIGCFWIEALFLRRRLHPRSWRRFVDGSDNATLCGLAASGKGSLVATSYFGNPAVAAFVAGQFFRPVHVVVDYLDEPAARTWQQEMYSLPGVRPLAVVDALSELPELLRAGQSVMLVVEHRRRRGRGQRVDFLGETGAFQPTIGLLAAEYNVPVVPILCRRRGAPLHFVFWSGTPVSGDDPTTITSAVFRQLEAEILHTPEQYLWSATPPGPGPQSAAPTADGPATGMESGTPASRRTR